MHELSLVEHLLAQCREHAQGRVVQSVQVRVGALTCVNPDALQFCFQACCSEAGMASAQLHIQLEPAQAECQRCGAAFAATELPVICGCGSSDCSLHNGQDVVLMALDLSADSDGSELIAEGDANDTNCSGG